MPQTDISLHLESLQKTLRSFQEIFKKQCMHIYHIEVQQLEKEFDYKICILKKMLDIRLNAIEELEEKIETISTHLVL